MTHDISEIPSSETFIMLHITQKKWSAIFSNSVTFEKHGFLVNGIH